MKKSLRRSYSCSPGGMERCRANMEWPRKSKRSLGPNALLSSGERKVGAGRKGVEIVCTFRGGIPTPSPSSFLSKGSQKSPMCVGKSAKTMASQSSTSPLNTHKKCRMATGRGTLCWMMWMWISSRIFDDNEDDEGTCPPPLNWWQLWRVMAFSLEGVL
jgi:hypothetical protein